MARKRRKRKARFLRIKGLMLCLIVALAVLIFVGMTRPSIDYETDIELPNKAERQIKGFVHDAYKYMGTWKETDLSKWFHDDYQEEALMCQTAYDLLVEMRGLRDNDLRFKNKGVRITVTEIEETDDGYVVYFEEAYKCKFNFMDEVSESQGIACTMGLIEDEGGYKLTEYTREEDFYSYITAGYETGSANPKEALNHVKESVLEEFKGELYNLKELKDSAEYKEVACDVAYDRDSAKDYALEYALERNEDGWFAFDYLGGNCQNFGSQVIHAGGVPMDLEGDAVWKYFDLEPDETTAPSGRSTSWSGVTYFYLYANANFGTGLCAEVDANIYTAEAGDIMQVGDGTGDFVHTIVSLGPITDRNGEIIDINTVSNTTDRKNYPLSAYNCPYVRLIKIYGHNN